MRKHDNNRKARLVKEWQSLGERKSDFAARHGIGLSTFYHWTRHLKVSEQPKKAEGFQVISIDEPEATLDIKPIAIIHYSSGTTLELYTQVDVRHLKTLVR